MGEKLEKLRESAKKTHCIRGHEFNEENTRIYKGGRHCRACARLYYHEHKQTYQRIKENEL